MSDNIYSKLIEIQAELVVPKNRVNNFNDNLKYRNAEDILSAAKPLCHKRGLCLLLTDKITNVGGNNYVEATAKLTDGNETIEVTASAREAESKPKFDASQCTGSASSYARKYALNGLFNLDDAADPDSLNPNDNGNRQGQQNTKRQQRSNNQKQQPVICPKCGKPIEPFKGKSGKMYQPAEILKKYGMCGDCAARQKAEMGAQ